MDRTNNTVDASALNSIGATVKFIPTNGIKIYAVKESQLNDLEKGSQADLFLEMGILCWSIFASFVASLFLANCEGKVFTTFLCITIITLLSGITFIILWYRQRKSKKTVIEEIRNNEFITNNIYQ